MTAMLLPLAILVSAAAAADAPKPLTSAAALTISLERGPTPLQLPMEQNAQGEPKIHPRWALTIDASGRVVTLESIGSPPVPAVRAPLENAIRAWHFQPGTIDGNPAETRTTFSLDLSLVEHGADQFALRIDDARTGANLAVKGMHGVYPKFPHDALRHKKQRHGRACVSTTTQMAMSSARVFTMARRKSTRRSCVRPANRRGAGRFRRKSSAAADLREARSCRSASTNYLEHDPVGTTTCAWNAAGGTRRTRRRRNRGDRSRGAPRNRRHRTHALTLRRGGHALQLIGLILARQRVDQLVEIALRGFRAGDTASG